MTHQRRSLTATITAGLLLIGVVGGPATTAEAAPIPPSGPASPQVLSGGSMAAAAAADPATVFASLAGLRTAAGGGSGTWVPAPQSGFTLAPGEACDDPTRVDPTLDSVVMMTLSTWPNGTPRRTAYVGGLVVTVTDTATGHATTVDASASAIVDSFPDGSMVWYVFGPIIATFRAGVGNLPRGLYQINGLYRFVLGADGSRTVTMAFGTTQNVCDRR